MSHQSCADHGDMCIGLHVINQKKRDIAFQAEIHSTIASLKQPQKLYFSKL